MNAALGLLAVLLLTVLTGYFVAQEFAFVAADRSALRQQAEAGDQAAARALAVTGRLSFMLSGAQLGITVTTLIVSFIARPAVADVISPGLGALGVPPSATDAIALALGLIISTILGMIFGELAPKNLGIARPEPVAKALASSTLLYLKIAGPVIRLFDSAATRLLRRVGVEPVEEVEHGATPEELDRIIAESERAGELPHHLSELLDRALDFGDMTAEDVMVPRPEVVSLRARCPVDEALATLRRTGHSRYPVLGEDSDDVLGVLGVRELLTWVERPGATIGDIARPPLLVTATAPLPSLLQQMRDAGEEFACVIDEYGGLAGVVTLEDMAEELVGEIVDENDPEPPGVTELPDGSWVLAGVLRLDEAERATGVRLPRGEGYETVGGLVLALLGRLPVEGDEVRLELPAEDLLAEDLEPAEAVLTVAAVNRRVPSILHLSLAQPVTSLSRTSLGSER
ncbi:hemolysin family protein [Bailinhaonella thermotolerans]|uniref:HlyC/CorC family transporter n=1 Tax=Bailinhaonella thermotolerans TaxID=1070861 RepID=A0A3A4AU99_9ACTN|nr:hemolysin family protein [Bailinhaonella thermotolerans]RJL32199.1 HlyC/CorC family transporter [Bailinhaonella thermotolerans]